MALVMIGVGASLLTPSDVAESYKGASQRLRRQCATPRSCVWKLRERKFTTLKTPVTDL